MNNAEILERLDAVERRFAALESRQGFDLHVAEGLTTLRAIELLEILTLKVIALRRGFVSQEELDETERELTAATQVDRLLTGELGSRITLLRQLERQLLASRGEAE